MLRAGDLVYLTVPDGGRQVFEFDPVPVNPADAYGGSATGVQYRANFIAMDGSGATLSFNFANFQPFNPYQVDSEVPQTLYYNARDDEFGYAGATGGNYEDNSGDAWFGPVDDQSFIGFNPAAYRMMPGGPPNGTWVGWDPYLLGNGTYQLTEANGTSYKIDAGTGAIESVSDQNGNTTTYTYANARGSAGTVTATDALGRTVFTVNTNAGNQVTSVQIAGQNPITYGYTNGELASVVNQINQQTTYAYINAQFPSFLTGGSGKGDEYIYALMADQSSAAVNSNPPHGNCT